MIGWGIVLIVLGAGSLLLPMIGIQFRLMEVLDDFQPWAGIVVAVIGSGLVLLGMNRSSPEAPTVQTATGPVPPATDEDVRRDEDEPTR